MSEKAKIHAEGLIETFSIKSAPVPVEWLAHCSDIHIRFGPTDDYSGILVRRSKREGRTLMGINNNESPGRMRFSIAHELGHYFLHKDKVTVDYRNNKPGEPRPKKEKEADIFAANLLMPKKFIEVDFEIITEKGIFFEKHLDVLAKKYQVSKQAMQIRLIKLNLVPSDVFSDVIL